MQGGFENLPPSYLNENSGALTNMSMARKTGFELTQTKNGGAVSKEFKNEFESLN